MAAALEREIRALAAGQLPDRRDRFVLVRVDEGVGAEVLGPRQPLGAGVERDHARPHGGGELGRAQADRPLAEDRDGVARGQAEAPKAVPVPQEIAAPVVNVSSSGSGTKVRAGTFM